MGNELVQHIISGAANGPILVLTVFLKVLTNSSSSSKPTLRVVKQHIPCPLMGWGYPIAAACATASWATKADSISAVPMRCPDTFITSSTRPVIHVYPSLSLRHPSPGK